MQQTERKPLFDLGQLVATPGALAALEKSGQSPMDFLTRHVTGDWGELCEEDRKENQFSLQKGFRLLSSYKTNAGETTLLNALGKFIPPDERILLIEDTAEIQLAQSNLVRFEARREQNGVPAVSIRDLLRRNDDQIRSLSRWMFVCRPAAWYVKYRVQVRQQDGSIKFNQRAKMLGRVERYPRESDIMPLKVEFMHRLNAGKFTRESSMNLKEFVENIYLPYIDELRASTRKGYREIWTNHISGRVGKIRLREFRTVDASRMLKAIAAEHDLSKTMLQHIKSVLSAVFTHAKNEGTFDGVNPVQDARIPRNAREARETFAYNLTQIRSILNVLPLLPKAAIATASFAGLREGELRGLEWPDLAGDSLTVNRSI